MPKAFLIYLKFDGTPQRDVVRLGVVNIAVSFSVTAKWLKRLTWYKQKIPMDYFDTGTVEMKKTELYVDGFKRKMVKDTSCKGLWTVSLV